MKNEKRKMMEKTVSEIGYCFLEFILLVVGGLFGQGFKFDAVPAAELLGIGTGGGLDDQFFALQERVG